MKDVTHQYDFVVVGAGLSGMAAAVMAARSGLKVALVQDRPVLGGNASKEIRIILSGASLCNYAYWRETGLMEELLLDNVHSNPTCSAEGWDLVLQNSIKRERNIDLFLNTTATAVEMHGSTHLAAVRAIELGAETWHTFQAPFFADCTGDGTVAVLAGASFRMGCEARAEFDESLAPETAEPRVMGHSLFFRGHDAGRPIPFTLPPWAPYRFTESDFGPDRPVCLEFKRNKGGYWWLEWGGDLDTIHDNARITNNIRMIVYGVWDYLKNRSPLRDELATWELEWTGDVAGKRESRRLEGDHWLTQNDIQQQRHFDDAVAFGGWALDDHPPAGFFDPKYPSWAEYLAGPYNIPLRSLYSKTVENLFFAGRNISVTHVALSSTRVMLTCGQIGEAVGAAAAICHTLGKGPRQLLADGQIGDVQRLLQRADHHLFNWPYVDPANLATAAHVSASSELASAGLETSVGATLLDNDRLLQFPLITPHLKKVDVLLSVAAATTLSYTLSAGAANGSSYPAEPLHSGTVPVDAGAGQWVTLPMDVAITRSGWHFVELKANPLIRVHEGINAPVGVKLGVVRSYDWIRPNPHSRWYGSRTMQLSAYCLRLDPPQPVYGAANVINEWARPNHLPQLWTSAETTFAQPEWLELKWQQPQTVNEVHLLFDSALDVYLTSLWNSFERTTLPSLVRDYRVLVRDMQTGAWREVASVKGNYVRHCVHKVDAVKTDGLRLEVIATNGVPRAQVFAVRVY